PLFKRGGRVKIGSRDLEIRARGTLRTEHLVVDSESGEELARIRGRSFRLADGEQAEWKSLGRKQGYGLVGPGGEPWLRAKVSSGLVRTTGLVEVAQGRDPALPAVLAAYLLIRRAEQAASAASSVIVVT
ncbi:MAG TPA: hypothetical protein VE757_04530, partial [Gaiellaceae bacterium]|nr:hypothetical protein [Gaiellaceae bacterium]